MDKCRVGKGGGAVHCDRRSLALRACVYLAALCSEAQPSSGQEKGSKRVKVVAQTEKQRGREEEGDRQRQRDKPDE